jgi:YgiT-type zinc finger domain-containing protein
MTCDVRGAGERKLQEIRYTLTIGERLVVVDRVPAEVCDRCGEISLAPAVVERLQHAVWKERPSKMVETEVYEFV